MIQKNQIVLLVFSIILLISCKSQHTKKEDVVGNRDIAESPLTKRFAHLVKHNVNPNGIPRSIDKDFNKLKTSTSTTWTSGFFAGNLWYIYLLTNDKRYKEKAIQWTSIVEKEKTNGGDHDIGFKIYNSFGNGYKVTQNQEYVDVIVKSANTLITRYDDKVKAIQSWNSKKGVWDYPVIIDNMMNLELLFEASLLSQDDRYYNVAVNHANTTLKNHFRDDNSTYHVVDYFPDGSLKAKKTHQGYSDSSAWSRGQAWAVYGFTMSYRYTKNEDYLKQAEKTAMFYLNHKKLPVDGIPFWDFNDPDVPNAPKDVSAATIMASAFFELYEYTQSEVYLNYANKVLKSLNMAEYMLDHKVEAPFILNRSTGNYNKNSEIDCPIVYADYYYLEALLRQKNGLKLQ